MEEKPSVVLNREVAVMPEDAVMERCPLWKGLRCENVSAVERCPLWKGVRCGEVSVTERCPLWRDVR